MSTPGGFSYSAIPALTVGETSGCHLLLKQVASAPRGPIGLAG